jgi:hypothetical protein
LAFHTGYSQSYPIAKTIGKDSVVIITTKQAEKINASHTILKDSVSDLIMLNMMTDLRGAQQAAFSEGLYKELKRVNLVLDDRDREIVSLKRTINRTIFQGMLLIAGWTIYTGIKSRSLPLINKL